jgi:hypothetical protein
MLKVSVKSTEEESHKMDLETNNVEDKMTTLDKSIMALHTKTKDLRDDILSHASQ